MKIRQISKSLNTINEVLRFVVLTLSLFIIMAQIIVCVAYPTAKIGFPEEKFGAVTVLPYIDILIGIVSLFCTFGKSALYGRWRIRALIILESFTFLCFYSYLAYPGSIEFFLEESNTLGSSIVALVALGLISVAINLIVNFVRYQIIYQLEVVRDKGFVECNKENLKDSYIESLHRNQNRAINLFDYLVFNTGIIMIVHAILIANECLVGVNDISVSNYLLIFAILVLLLNVVWHIVSRKFNDSHVQYFCALFAHILMFVLGLVFLFIALFAYNQLEPTLAFFSGLVMLGALYNLGISIQYIVFHKKFDDVEYDDKDESIFDK